MLPHNTKKPCDDSSDSQLSPALSSAWQATAQTLSDAVAAVSEAGSAVAAKAMEIGAAGVDVAKDIAETSTTVFSGSRLASAVEYLDNALEERGIKDAFTDAAEAVGDKLDQVTGKQLVELLEEKLRLQDTYNDVLATRLAEALHRIAALERRL